MRSASMQSARRSQQGKLSGSKKKKRTGTQAILGEYIRHFFFP